MSEAGKAAEAGASRCTDHVDGTLCQQCGKSIEAAQVQPDNADIQVGTVWTMTMSVVLTAITFKLARHGASGSGVQACKNVCVMVSSVHQLPFHQAMQASACMHTCN